MPVRIKICGIRDAATARHAAACGAHAIGLVFVPASPRHVTLEAAEAITAALPPFVEPVGVFTDQDPEFIREAAAAAGLRTVQLHGPPPAAPRPTPPPELAAALAPLRLIRAFRSDLDDLERALAAWAEVPTLQAIMIDAPPPPGAEPGLPGGHGRPLETAPLARRLRGTRPRPLILAGGLHAGNVAEAIEALAPSAVDVSSGVESSRGVKDPDRIAAFCRAAQSAATGC